MNMTTMLARKYARRRALPIVRDQRSTNQSPVQNPSRLPYYGGYFAAIAAGCWLFGWTTSIRLGIVGSIGLLLLTVHWLWPQRRSVRNGRTVLPASGLGGLVRGLCIGTLVIGSAAIAMPVVRYLPIHVRYLDRDRGTVEQQVRAYVDAGAFEAACSLLERRLKQPLTRQWRQDLQTWHVDILTQAGNTATDTDTSEAYWTKATGVAGKYGIGADIAQVKLHALHEQQKHEDTLADLQRTATEARQNKLRSTIASLKSSRDFAGLDTLLRLEMQDLPRDSWPLPLDQLRIDNLIDWGDASHNLPAKEAQYAAAVDLARQLGRDPRLAESRLNEVRQEQNNQPAVLPSGTVGRILGDDSPGNNNTDSHHIDLALHVSGKFLYGLNAKDFRVLTAARHPVPFELVELESAEERAVNVVLLLDESPSTANLRQPMHLAATTLVRESPPSVRFRAMKFSDTAQFVTNWTNDPAEVARALAMPFNGQSTALRSSLRAAVAELRRQHGVRLLVLFTDGNEPVPVTTSDQGLVNECRAAGVRVLAIGLVNEHLDERLLSRLSADTDGVYLRVEKHAELVDRFRRIRTHVVRPAYRIRFSQPVSEDVTIYIGSGDTQIVLPVPSIAITSPPKGVTR